MAFQSVVAVGRPHISARSSLAASPLRATRTHVPIRRPKVISCIPSSTESASTEPATSATPPDTFTQTAKLEPPPNTFFQAITQAQQAVDAALALSHTLLEVEFPPLPTSELESAAVGAYEVSDANLRLVIDFADRYAERGQRVVLAFPDRIERNRAEDQYTPRDNIRLSCLRDSASTLWIERLWVKPTMEKAVTDEDDMFIVLGASCQELPDVERLVEAASNRPVIFFNLKLDSARGDLGLPAFPRKDLHDRFLSKILPVYYLRTRTYSRSITRPPYVVNYSGALFRVFPGSYQVLLDTSAGNYRRLSTLNERPPLGEVRDILTDGMNLGDGEKKTKNSFMYRGYKSRTWWEGDRKSVMSNVWKS